MRTQIIKSWNDLFLALEYLVKITFKPLEKSWKRLFQTCKNYVLTWKNRKLFSEFPKSVINDYRSINLEFWFCLIHTTSYFLFSNLLLYVLVYHLDFCFDFKWKIIKNVLSYLHKLIIGRTVLLCTKQISRK